MDGTEVGGESAEGLLVGVGNDHRRDDGVGRAVVRALSPRLPSSVQAVLPAGGPADLLDLWEGKRLVVVVDAVRSGGPPGAVRRLEVGDRPLERALPPNSTHGLSLGEAVDLGRALDRLPRRLVVYGVEVGDVGVGDGLSPAVAAAVPSLADQILAEFVSGPPGGPDRPARGTHA